MAIKYLEKLEDTVNQLDNQQFEIVKQLIMETSRKGHQLFLLGEGVNSATADHFAVDLTKNVGISLGNFGFSIKTVAMNQLMPLSTALANDVCQEKVYAEILRLLATSGDLLVVLSDGLAEESIQEAVLYARENGIKIAAIAGELTPEDKEMIDGYIEFEASNSHISQDVILFLTHALTYSLMKEMKYPVVFLDRDGVINYDSDDYIKSVSEFNIISGAAEAIRLLNMHGYAVVVVTNQAIIGRGLATREDVEEIHEYLRKELLKKGAVINNIYYCPHAPEEHCDCRKPLAGLHKKAFEEMPIDREDAIMIGDRISDVQSGVNAGIPNIFIGKQNLSKELEESIIYYADNLLDAVTWFIKKRERK